LQGGGKEESATGVGTEVNKIQEAMDVAERVYKSNVEGA
jgi:alanyl-tRNA synthetase